MAALLPGRAAVPPGRPMAAPVPALAHRAAVLSRLPRRRFRSRANAAEAIALHC